MPTDEFHPCHAKVYTCRKPAKQRFYAPRMVALAGMQMKFGISDTWACDECWVDFEKALKDNGS